MIHRPEQDQELATRDGVDITTVKPRPEVDWEQMETRKEVDYAEHKRFKIK